MNYFFKKIRYFKCLNRGIYLPKYTSKVLVHTFWYSECTSYGTQHVQYILHVTFSSTFFSSTTFEGTMDYLEIFRFLPSHFFYDKYSKRFLSSSSLPKYSLSIKLSILFLIVCLSTLKRFDN